MNEVPSLTCNLGKRPAPEKVIWTVQENVDINSFLQSIGIVAIGQVLQMIEAAKSMTNDSKIWDNYGYREYIVLLWLKLNYGVDDLARRSGRSGPDCISEIGGKKNIEVKTTSFKRRKRLTASYDLGQFSRQHTAEIRQFTRSIDGIAYAVLFDERCLPAFIIFLHGDDIIDAHNRLLEQKQNDFLAKKPGGQKGGRDTISVKMQELCLILSEDKKSQFHAWIHGQLVQDWRQFLEKVKTSGVELR